MIKNQTEWVSNFQSKYEYDKNISVAPTQSLLQKWLREKHKMYAFVHNEIGNNHLFYYYTIKSDNFSTYEIGRYKNYEEALEDALVECLQNVSETVA